MSACHETDHKVFSRNTCRKIGSNAFEKKKRSCPFFACNGKGEEAKKKSLSSDWAENLAGSNEGLILRPGAMAEGVERAAKCRMRPVGFHINI